MANLNKVLLIGRLTRDPETRTIPSGTTVTSFGLAVNRTYTRRDSGEKVEETCFVDVEAWGRQGETIARYMRKGRQIFIEGRLKFDSWERDGQRRSKLSVVADGFQFLDSQNGGGQNSGSQGGGQAYGGQASRDQASRDQASRDQASGDQASGDQASGGQFSGGSGYGQQPARAGAGARSAPPPDDFPPPDDDIPF